MTAETTPETPGGASLQERISGLLSSLTTLALATVDSGGNPCAAAVYFAHDADLTLYFISAKTTVHGANLLRDPRVAAMAYEEHQEWNRLRGLQLRGTARPVELLEFSRAASVYGGKYSFLSILSQGTPAELLKAMAKVTFWKLEPSWIRLTDNSRGFGFKEELSPGAPGGA
jgi:uncharacterized protein YhbP (UPF0306 family)